MREPWASRLKFRRYMVVLRFTRPAVFRRFQHGGVVRGLLSAVLGVHELPSGLIPFACESGRVRFEPGEEYRIGVTLVESPVTAAASGVLDDGRSVQDRLAEGFLRVGHEKTSFGGPLPVVSGNFDLITFEVLPPPDLEQERSALAGCEKITLRFLSPFRLERPRELKAKGAAYLNRDYFPPDLFLNRLWNRLFYLENGRYPTTEEKAAFRPPVPNDVRADSSDLLWLDLPVEGKQGRKPGQPKGYTLGGAVGRVEFTDFPESWLESLSLGRHIHAGENTSYGLGRYVIEEAANGSSDPFRPSVTLLGKAADTALLDEALGHVLSRSEAAGVDNVSPEDFALARNRLLADLSLDLREGRYMPSPLLGFVVTKDDGRLRALAIPTVRDRVAQRAANEVLGAAVETLLEDCSYAYRKGFSRKGAAQAIRKAYEEGYRFVLDADITSFFDAVDWSRLFGKLDALFPYEPLIGFVKEWVRAPVMFEGRRIVRTRGLPQGSAVSPLLANLFLDELDEEMLGRDFRLVRFADDFVVLCKDIEAARKAKAAAEEALARLGLTLNPKKTAVRSIDDGFTYLGYLFCRSLVMEDDRKPEETVVPAQDTLVPAASWLAQVPLQTIKVLPPAKGNSRRAKPIEPVPLADAGSPLPYARCPLYILDPEAEIGLREETLVVRKPGQEATHIPIRSLAHAVLVGKVRATLPFVLSLGRHGIPVYFCRRNGELYATLASHEPDWPVWAAQGEASGNNGLRREFAREVVSAKLHNFAAIAVRFKLENSASVAEEIRELERSCANKDSMEGLMGLEGKGAALYFGAMKTSLAEMWGFEGRRKNPPPDPVNAMLSFGYTLLYNHISTALVAAGLHPRIGLFHEEKGAYHALASDVQEEFRHLADAQVWAMVHRGEVGPEDFAPSSDGRFPCLMSREFRSKFIGVFEDRLMTRFTPEEGEETTYRAFMDIQARLIRELVTGRLARYRALRAHS